MGKVGKTLLIIVLSIIGFVTLPWLLLFVGLMLIPTPKDPTIKHGEFPFELEYELNGRRHAVKDTVICDYEGVAHNEAVGKRRTWNSRRASGKGTHTLLETKDGLTFIFFEGSAEYYMGDKEPYQIYDGDPVGVKVWGSTGSNQPDEELLQKYHLKIIRVQHAKPIKNTFK